MAQHDEQKHKEEEDKHKKEEEKKPKEEKPSQLPGEHHPNPPGPGRDVGGS